MPEIRSALRPFVPLLLLLVAAGCSGDRVGGDFLGSGTPAEPAQSAAAPINMAGRWLLSSPGRGQCNMTFNTSPPNNTEGTIAPEGGCPGRFYMSRKWSYDPGGSLVVRDHNGQPLGQLSRAGATFEGKASSGDAVTLTR
jgi:hypothetical protein